MEADAMYEMMVDAVKQALREEQGGGEPAVAKRMVDGKVVFIDGEGRTFKEIDVFSLFRKVTAVREKLRVLEQKLNNHDGLAPDDRVEFQGYITKCYGTLTTFNFLFRDEADKFRGVGD